MQSSMENSEPETAQMRVNCGNLREVLGDLRGGIYFVKDMTASNVRSLDPDGKFTSRSTSCQLTLPNWFVKANGSQFRRSVVLRTGLSNKTWDQRLSCYSRSDHTPSEFIFTGGWIQFATDNGLVKGDILVFSLTAMSKFQVYMFDRHGLPKAPQMLQEYTMCSKKIKVSQKENKSIGNKLEDLTPEEIKNLVDKSCVTRPTGRANSEDEFADPASNDAPYQNLSHNNTLFSKAKIVEGSPMKIPPNAGLDEEPHSEQEEGKDSITKNSNVGISVDRNLNCSVVPKNHARRMGETLLPASFQKQLSEQNVHYFLEIPMGFVKKYGSRLQTRVQLQGIHEGSPVRDVGRVSYMSRGKPRFYLKDGWYDFVKDNMLRAGQDIRFTLTADSFFVVREVIS